MKPTWLLSSTRSKSLHPRPAALPCPPPRPRRFIVSPLSPKNKTEQNKDDHGRPCRIQRLPEIPNLLESLLLDYGLVM